MYKNVTRRNLQGSLRRRMTSFSCVALLATVVCAQSAVGQSITQGAGYPASNNGGYPAQSIAGFMNAQQGGGANYVGAGNAFQSVEQFGGQNYLPYGDQYGAQFVEGGSYGFDGGSSFNGNYAAGYGGSYGNLITTSNPDVPPQYALDENGAIIPFPTEGYAVRQGDESENSDSETESRTAPNRLGSGFGARRTALDIWSEFLFGKKSPTRSNSLFAQPRRTQPTDKLEPNPLFRLLTFGLFAARDDQNDGAEEYQGYETAEYDPYSYQEGVGGDYFEGTNGFETTNGFNPGFGGYEDPSNSEYLQNAFLPSDENYGNYYDNSLGRNDTRRNVPNRAKAPQTRLLANDALIAKNTLKPQTRPVRTPRPTSGQIARSNVPKVQNQGTDVSRNDRALAANSARNLDRNVASNQARVASQRQVPSRLAGNERQQPRREVSKVAQRQKPEQRQQNNGALAQNARQEIAPQTAPRVDELTDEELSAAHKRRIEELNAILASKRPLENASHIQQTSAMERAAQQRRIAERNREIKNANLQFQEKELARYRNSGIRQVAHAERQPLPPQQVQRSAQVNARTNQAQPQPTAQPRAATPLRSTKPAAAPNRAKTSQPKKIVPQPVPTYDSGLSTESQEDVDQEALEEGEDYDETEENSLAEPAPTAANQKPVVKRPKASFIDPKEAW